MARTIELEVKVGGINDINNQIQSLESSLEKMKSQLKNVDAGSDEFNKLTKAISETENQMKEMSESAIEAEKTTGNLKSQLRAMTDELQGLQPGSERFNELSLAAGQLRRQIEDTNAVIKATAGGPLQNLAKGLSTATSVGINGFAAVRGAMAAFGVQSENLQKTMVQLQGLMTMTTALQGLGGIQDSIVNLRASFGAFFTSARAGLSGIQKAIIATGIGALVVAVGLLVAYWDDVLKLTMGVSKELNDQVDASKQNVKQKELELKALSLNENALKLQGKTERQILETRIAATKNVIEEQKLLISFMEERSEMEIKAAERNAEIAKNVIRGALELSAIVLRGLAAPIDAVIATANEVSEFLGFGEITTFSINEEISNMLDKAADFGASFLFDAEAMRKKNNEVIQAEKDKLAELTNAYNGYLLEIQRLDKEAADKNRSAAERRRSAELSRLLKQFDDEEKLRDALQAERIEKLEGYERGIAEVQEKWYQVQRALEAEAVKEELESLNERFIKGTLSEKQYREERERLMDFAVMKFGEKERELSRINGEQLRKQEEELNKKWRIAAQTLLNDILLTEGEKQLATIEKNYSDRKKALDDFLKAGLISEEEYSRAVQKITADRESALAEIEKKARDKSFSDRMKTISDLGRELNKFASTLGEGFSRIFTSFNEGIKNFMTLTKDGIKKDLQSIAELTAAITGAITGAIGGLFSILSEERNRNLENDLRKTTDVYNEQLDSLNNMLKMGQLTEEQFNRKKFAADVKKFNDEEKLKKQAFDADKGMRIGQAIMAGAQGAIAAFAGAMQLGPIAGPIVGTALAAAVASLTALQVGVITSQEYKGSSRPSAPTLGGIGGAGGSTFPELSPSTLFGSAFGGSEGGSEQMAGKQQQQPIKAYVVESDITTVQNTIDNLKQRSEIG